MAEGAPAGDPMEVEKVSEDTDSDSGSSGDQGEAPIGRSFRRQYAVYCKVNNLSRAWNHISATFQGPLLKCSLQVHVKTGSREMAEGAGDSME